MNEDAENSVFALVSVLVLIGMFMLGLWLLQDYELPFNTPVLSAVIGFAGLFYVARGLRRRRRSLKGRKRG